jgi:hypothetical protein
VGSDGSGPAWGHSGVAMHAAVSRQNAAAQIVRIVISESGMSAAHAAVAATSAVIRIARAMRPDSADAFGYFGIDSQVRARTMVRPAGE